jgi:hypothetical protein
MLSDQLGELVAVAVLVIVLAFVLALLEAGINDTAHRERRRAMAAAVGERPDPAGGIAEQHERLAEDPTRQRRLAEFVGPGGDRPGVTQEHALSSLF